MKLCIRIENHGNNNIRKLEPSGMITPCPLPLSLCLFFLFLSFSFLLFQLFMSYTSSDIDMEREKNPPGVVPLLVWYTRELIKTLAVYSHNLLSNFFMSLQRLSAILEFTRETMPLGFWGRRDALGDFNTIFTTFFLFSQLCLFTSYKNSKENYPQLHETLRP